MSDATFNDGTVGKALAVLDKVAAFGRPVRFGELLESSAFPKSSLYRFLQILTSQGMLDYDEHLQTYAPGPRLLRLAHAAWTGFSLGPIATPQLVSLAADVQETVHLAQLDHAQVLYLDRLSPSNTGALYASAGKIGPAYCTAVGKAMLAWLDDDALRAALSQQSFHRFTASTLTDARALRTELARIRSRGHALDREEHEPGIICIALPVLSAGNRPIAAVSVTSTTTRSSIEVLEGQVPRIRAATDAIEAEARYRQFPERPKAADRERTSACPVSH